MDDIPPTPPKPAANGQAYRAYLEHAQAVLEALTVESYYPSPMPDAADDALAEIVSAFTAWPTPVREGFLAQLPHQKRGLFGIFGHRAATLAVRRTDADLLRLGLIGNLIANSPIPPNRNVEAALAVFYHCARKLNLEPIDLFSESSQFADEEMAARLLSFGNKPDVTLKQYGWREIKTPDGVRYKFEW
jgi:hypothetical protein